MKLFYLLLCYLSGSIPTAYLLTRLFTGQDIRHYGSGNPGATNVFRVVGVPAGILTLAIDFLKGFAPVYFIRHEAQLFVLAAIIFTVLGHTATVFLRFRGGKGVITGCGALTAATPHLAIVGLTVFLITFFVFRYVSLSSILSAFAIISYVWVRPYPYIYRVALTLLALLVILRHRANIRRLLDGSEPKVKL